MSKTETNSAQASKPKDKKGILWILAPILAIVLVLALCILASKLFLNNDDNEISTDDAEIRSELPGSDDVEDESDSSVDNESEDESDSNVDNESEAGSSDDADESDSDGADSSNSEEGDSSDGESAIEPGESAVSGEGDGKTRTYAALKGEGVTHLARKAIADVLADNNLSVGPEQMLYMETNLKNISAPAFLEIGETRSFTDASILDLHSGATQLSQHQLNLWGRYL